MNLSTLREKLLPVAIMKKAHLFQTSALLQQINRPSAQYISISPTLQSSLNFIADMSQTPLI